MLEHLNPTPQKPSRVVVLGAYGFVGGTCARRLAARDVPVLALDKDDIDLMASGAAEQLQTRLAPDDAVLVVSARAPCKDTGMMVDNIRIMHAVCTALERSSVNHVVYFSSDAVYSDAPVPLTEESRTEPGSMHGTMHLARELMLKATVKAPLAVVRSTLIYGDGDPHNAYSPNRSLRLPAGTQGIHAEQRKRPPGRSVPRCRSGYSAAPTRSSNKRGAVCCAAMAGDGGALGYGAAD